MQVRRAAMSKDLQVRCPAMSESTVYQLTEKTLKSELESVVKSGEGPLDGSVKDTMRQSSGLEICARSCVSCFLPGT